MNEAARLRVLVVRFLRLETIAEALYRQHLAAVPASWRSLFEHFVAVEAHHRQIFERYYQTLYGLPLPTFRFSTFAVCLVAKLLHLFGKRTTLRFECWIEALAIADYSAALEWVEEPRLRRLIHEVLHDEEQHLPFTEALLVFRAEEEEHIRRMTALTE